MYIFLVLVGLWFTVGTGFWQIRNFGKIFKKTFGSMFKKQTKDGISPFQAMSTALASTVGTGNIAGVATAITAGGPGAIFWMWISSFLGMMTKFAEVALAVHFRKKDDRGEWVGGPMYTIERGMGKKWKWLAVVFSVLCMSASLGVGNITQVNTMAHTLSNSFGVSPLTTGIVTAILAGFVILGGVKTIAQVSEFLVPFMSGIYIIASALVLIAFSQNIIPVFKTIFIEAFNPGAAVGGVCGYTVQKALNMGFRRGIFSNEAGLGSAPIAHASAQTRQPVEQGMWGAVEVFVDTIVLCTLTALVILCSGAYNPLGFGGLDGAALTTKGFELALGDFGGGVISICTALFALATVFGWSLYGERCCVYLFKARRAKYLYRFFYIILLIPGALMNVDAVWMIADFLNGLMAAPNLISLIVLSPVVFSLIKKYERDMR